MIKEDTIKYSSLIQQFNLLVDEPMKKHTSFNIGGPADLLAMPEDKEELKNLLKKASSFDIPTTFIGGGTNLLITDKGIRGLVVIMSRLKSEIKLTDHNTTDASLYVEAGTNLSKACVFAMNNSLCGLEFAAGIPGTIGGAIMMNAGTATDEISNIIESLDLLNLTTLNIETIQRDALDFSYRNLNQSGIITGVKLNLKKADKMIIEERFNRNLKLKNKTQPVSFASAGCFFKNPKQGPPAGKLIEDTGFKGKTINDAMVSKIHANYIVNINNATAKDILLLKQSIEEAVFKKYQIKLETEVRVKGE
jgi:UDP-N-acetylmuramate dehydrogenase